MRRTITAAAVVALLIILTACSSNVGVGVHVTSPPPRQQPTALGILAGEKKPLETATIPAEIQELPDPQH